MEELFFQQNQFGKQTRQANANGLGQSWEEINQGMKNTMFLHNIHDKGKSRFPQEVSKNGTRIQLNKSQSFKQLHRQPFKLKNNCPIPRNNHLKISRSITEKSQLKCYKLSADQQSKENVDNRLNLANKIKMGVSGEGDIIKDLMHIQKQNGRMLNNLSFKNSERYNYSQDKHNLNVIKEENYAAPRMKMKSQAVRIKSFDIYPIGHSPAFVSRFNNRDCISISKVGYFSEQKYQRMDSNDKLPIIKLENNFQITKKLSLSIHASNYKQKIFLLHRLSKNNNRQILKGQKQKSPMPCREQMGVKKYKLVLNPRLSKLKLFN